MFVSVIGGQAVSVGKTAYPVSFSINVTVNPTAATSRAVTSLDNIVVNLSGASSATARADTVDPNLPSSGAVGIGSMIIEDSFKVG